MTKHPAPFTTESHSASFSAKLITLFLIIFSICLFVHSSTCLAADPTLTWDANEDAEYYQVFMRGESDQNYTAVSSQIPAGTTSFRLMPSPDGRYYYFSVKAFNACGNSSDFSEPVYSQHVPYDSSYVNPDDQTSPPSDLEPSLPVYQPLSLEIILPEDGTITFAGTLVELSANIFRGDVLQSSYIVSWSSSIDGCLGVGLDVAASLSPGIHIITASSTDETGTTVSKTIVLYIQEINTEPTVAITDFVGGVSGTLGQAFTFKATAKDNQEGDISDRIVWASSLDGDLGTGASLSVTLSPGDHTMTARISDSKGLTSTASVNVTAVAYNAAPVMTLLEIVKGEATEQGLPVDIYGNASDLENGDISDKITWTSNMTGLLGKGNHIRATLSPGTHTITGTATDNSGKQGSDTATIVVPAYNYPPSLTLSADLSGTLSASGQTCILTGTATDKEDGDISQDLVWSSSISGPLGSGNRLIVNLVSGVHAITATVKDSQGKSFTDETLVNVGVFNAPPEITLGSSVAGDLTESGQDYTFNATAKDPEDGSINAFITWESSLDGHLGTGPGISTCLSSGDHVITVSACDSKSLLTSKTFEVSVGVFNSAPELSLGSAIADTLGASGQPYRFTATAYDREDGTISSFIVWNSSLNGYLGTGPDITATLSPGVHTVTASVNDRQGVPVSKTLEITVASYNSPPTVTITRSVLGTLDESGQGYRLTAVATDSEDGDISSRLTWTSSKDGSLGVGEDIRTTLSSGLHTVTAQVTDSKGLAASAVITVTVAAYNSPPSISFTSTVAGTLDQDGQDYTFSAKASDKENGDLSPSIIWESNIDGYLGKGQALTATLSTGSHTLMAHVTDSQGKAASASQSVTVNVYNHPPEIAITTVDKAAVGAAGQSFTFTGTASDKEDGNLGASMVWTSSIKGYLGTGGSISTLLSPGTHTITARITDSQGKISTVSRTVTADAYNNPPVVTIQSITQGTRSVAGQSCRLSGTASDKEDGTLSGAIVWSSSVSGNLGSGSSLTKTLAPGTHVIKASVADSKGLKSEVSKTITVESYNMPPTVSAIASLKGVSTLKGQTYTFSSSAMDNEDGDLSTAITWTSSLSGSLGVGSSIQAILPSGSHVITARVTDSKGNQGQAVKTIPVAWVNVAPSIQILDVKPGAAGTDGQVHELSATAIDEEEGNLSGSITWSSSRDGNLGVGARILSTLSTGSHTITASIRDSKGSQTNATRTLTVDIFNHPPVLTITSAIGGKQDSTGQMFEISGKATDHEDGTLSSRIRWTTAAGTSLGEGAVIRPHLSEGTHTVTATITDFKGKTDTQTVTVTSVKETKLVITVTTQNLFRLKLTKITWKGGSEGVEIYRNSVKIGSGPSEGTRYYWYVAGDTYKVCDGTGLKCSETKTGVAAPLVRKKRGASSLFSWLKWK